MKLLVFLCVLPGGSLNQAWLRDLEVKWSEELGL